MALFHTTVVDNQIKALDTIGTATGSIATFDTDRAERLVNLEVAITATQSGSGTPSPSNPRPINGFSACNLSVNGTTETIPFGQTIYGGSLNVGSGVLTVTHGIYTFNGLEAWAMVGTNRFRLNNACDFVDENGNNFTLTNVNMFGFSNTVTSSTDLPNETLTWFSVTSNIFVRMDSTSLSDFQTLLSNNNLQIEGKLTIPIEVQLDSKQIQAIIGTNNIYADTGDIIDLKFVLSVGKAIS